MLCSWWSGHVWHGYHTLEWWWHGGSCPQMDWQSGSQQSAPLVEPVCSGSWVAIDSFLQLTNHAVSADLLCQLKQSHGHGFNLVYTPVFHLDSLGHRDSSGPWEETWGNITLWYSMPPFKMNRNNLSNSLFVSSFFLALGSCWNHKTSTNETFPRLFCWFSAQACSTSMWIRLTLGLLLGLPPVKSKTSYSSSLSHFGWVRVYPYRAYAAWLLFPEC